MITETIMNKTERGLQVMWYEWFFDGIGSELVSLILGLLVGAAGGYKIGLKRNGLQKQVSLDNAKQEQELDIEYFSKEEKEGGVKGNVRQVQKAGEQASQKQIGRIK